jgi:integrase
VILREFYAACSPLLREGLTSNTIASNDRAWRLRVDPTLGAVPVAELRPLVILNAQASWGGVASTRNDARALLSRLLDYAVLDELIATNPMRSLPRVRSKAAEADPTSRALTDEQVARMFELTAFHPFGQRALAGLAFTGLRLGELVGLRWEDLDLDRELITIRRTFSPDGHGRLEERATKSGRLRTVPLLHELLPWLDLARRAGYPRIFTGSRGAPFDSGNLSRALRWPETRKGIAIFADGRELRFHDLRHTFLTRASRIGVTPANLQKIAGHASITTTELYTRTSSVDAALAAGEQLNRAGSDARGAAAMGAQGARAAEPRLPDGPEAATRIRGNREVTTEGGEAAENPRKLGTSDR